MKEKPFWAVFEHLRFYPRKDCFLQPDALCPRGKGGCKSGVSRHGGSTAGQGATAVQPQGMNKSLRPMPVGELCLDQRRSKAPETESARFFSRFGLASNFCQQKLWKEIANPPQKIQF